MQANLLKNKFVRNQIQRTITPLNKFLSLIKYRETLIRLFIKNRK